MSQIPVQKSGAYWYIGAPDVTPVIPERGQSNADALAVALRHRGYTREDLLFESDEQRAEFEADFG